MNKHKTLRVAGMVAALAAVGAVLAGGTMATADVAKGPVDNSIKIKGNNAPRFDAPEEVPFGVDLQIVNKTDPDKIGPHTFTLVAKSELPKGKDELKKCGQLKLICKKVAADHGVHPPSDFEIDDYDVDNGSEGWDTHYEGSTHGDSWLTETEGETTSRQLLATGTIRFMCVVHPEMQGKVKVLPIR